MYPRTGFNQQEITDDIILPVTVTSHFLFASLTQKTSITLMGIQGSAAKKQRTNYKTLIQILNHVNPKHGA